LGVSERPDTVYLWGLRGNRSLPSLRRIEAVSPRRPRIGSAARQRRLRSAWRPESTRCGCTTCM